MRFKYKQFNRLITKELIFRFFRIISFLIIFPASFSCKYTRLNDELTLYKVKKRDFENRIQVSGYLEAAKSYSIVCPRLRSDATILWLIPEGTLVKRGDTVCILEAAEVENRYLSALQKLENTKLEYNKISENLNLQYLLLKSQVQSIEATEQITKLDSAQKAFVSESEKKIISLEIRKAEFEKEKLQNKLMFLRKINESELVKLKLQINQSQNNVNRAKDILDQLVITSQNEGIVQYANNRGTNMKIAEGDIIWNRLPIVNIPDLSRMQVRLVVDEANYKRIDPGQSVEIKVDANPELLFKGKILRKSAAGKPIEEKSPVKVYEIYSSIDSIETDLLPGLSLSCSILLEEYPDTLAIPLTALFDQDSLKFVYLKSNRKYRKQLVTLVAQSLTEAVIDSGIREGDIISLIKPEKLETNP